MRRPKTNRVPHTPLTAIERHERRFNRLLAKAKEFRPHIYLKNFVSPVFHLMIRAQYAAVELNCSYVGRDGHIGTYVPPIGFVVCVTCGLVGPWRGGKPAAGGGFNTGHFIRKTSASVALEETNVAPQCAHCNLYRDGEQARFETWMRHVHGQDEIDRLIELASVKRKFKLEELVEMRIGFQDRLKKAERFIADWTICR